MQFTRNPFNGRLQKEYGSKNKLKLTSLSIDESFEEKPNKKKRTMRAQNGKFQESSSD